MIKKIVSSLFKFYLLLLFIVLHVAVIGGYFVMSKTTGYTLADAYNYIAPKANLPIGIASAFSRQDEWIDNLDYADWKPDTFMYPLYTNSVPDYGENGLFTPSRSSTIVTVDTVEELIRSIKNAKAGDIITLQPGKYHITNQTIESKNAGTPYQPIIVRAEKPGTVHFKMLTSIGFKVSQSFWVFENLNFEGICESQSHSYCEHVFQIIPNANATIIRNNKMVNFNAAIKVNGAQGIYPDTGLIENNLIYNTTVRNTKNPVTPIDIVGADNWVIRKNMIADFGKNGGNRVSYAAFIKGNSSSGRFDSNLIVCHLKLPPDNTIRLGLSFGGGGTEQRYCRNLSCESEHTSGKIENNIIANCPQDVGIYLNRATKTTITHNILIHTTGIDVRFKSSSAIIENNLISGKIRDRNSGSHHESNNVYGLRSITDLLPSINKLDFTYVLDANIPNKNAQRLPVDICNKNRTGNALTIEAMPVTQKDSCKLDRIFPIVIKQ